MEYSFEIYELCDGLLQDPCDDMLDSFYTFEEAQSRLEAFAGHNKQYVILRVFMRED